MRIAMWSGPRNLSTAMMYAFSARDDTAVWDEPYYAAYLQDSGLEHPLGAEILAAGERDAEQVKTRCLGATPHGKPVFYQKHMTHHMRPNFDLTWLADVTNIFLIRHPARVIASYAAKRENPSSDDIGFEAQRKLFDHVRDLTGKVPVVIDSADIRADPEAMLRRICDAIELDFQPTMLSWPKGGNADDGVWAKHWYGAVWTSTSFAGVEGDLPKVAPEFETLLKASQTHYDAMKAFKI